LLGGKKSFFHLLVIGLVLVLIFLHHEIMLALAFNGFLVYGLLNELRCQIFPSQRPKSWDETPVPSASPSQAALASVAGGSEPPAAENPTAKENSGNMPPV